MANSIKIPRVSDRKLIAVLKKLAATYPTEGITGTVAGAVYLSRWDFESPHADWDQVSNANGELLSDAAITLHAGLQLNYYRGGNVEVTLKSPISRRYSAYL
jgi:hypothetical protein